MGADREYENTYLQREKKKHNCKHIWASLLFWLGEIPNDDFAQNSWHFWGAYWNPYYENNQEQKKKIKMCYKREIV